MTYTHIEILLDRSGSMQTVREETERGLETFIEAQRTLKGNVTVSLTEFSDERRPVYKFRPVEQVPHYCMAPQGMTALYDSLAATVTDLKIAIKGMPKADRPDQVIVVILTDGAENCSKRFRGTEGRLALKDLILKRRRKGWVFTFLGANQDAVLEGTAIGVPLGSSVTYSSNNTEAAFGAAASLVTRGAKSGQYWYTKDERSELVT